MWWFVLVAPLMLAPGRIALARRDTMAAVPLPAPAARLVAAAHLPSAAPARPAPRRITEPPPIADAGPRLSWWSQVRVTDLLALAWLTGCGVLALRLVVGHRRVRRMLAESRPVQAAVALEALAQLCEEAGVRRRIELRSSHGVGAPLLYGLRRPTVLVPEEWLHSLSAGDVRALLAHEVAHVRRLDFLANLVQRLIEIPLFFHPGVWLASRRIVLAREELCDAWALGRGVEAGSYARSLAAAAERAHGRLAAPSVGVVESRFTLLRRVEAIMQTSSVRGLRRPLAITLAAIVLGAAAAFAAVQIGGGLPAGANQGLVGGTSQGAAPAAQEMEEEMKQLALAMLMYLQDADGTFPPTDDIKEIQALLGPYMATQDIFRRDLRYVMPPGVPVGSIELPGLTPVFALEDHPRVRIIAYADGRTRQEPKDGQEPARRRIVDLTVVHESGAPAGGARIRGVGIGGQDLVADDRGHRRIVIERAGSEASFYLESADGREHSLATVLFTGEREAKRVILHPPGTAAGTVSFSGRVVDKQGRPVEGAEVWVSGWAYPHARRDYRAEFLSRSLGKTGADGRFSERIARLPAGMRAGGQRWMEPWLCQVIAHKPGHGLGWVTTDGSAEVSALEIRLGEPAGLRGKVRDAEGVLLSQVRVRLAEIQRGTGSERETAVSFLPSGDVPAWAETRTDRHGGFSFAGLPADGGVKLDVDTCGAGESYRGDQMGPDLGAIELSKRRGDLDVALVRRPMITGVLLTPEGTPAAGVKVRAEGEIKGEPRHVFGTATVTDQHGRYDLEPVAGTYAVWAVDQRYYAGLAEGLEVDVGKVVDLGAATLERNGTLTGRVLDAETGSPIAGARVSCRGAGPSPFGTTIEARTQADGRFSVGAPPGNVGLLADPPPGYTWNHTVEKRRRGGEAPFLVREERRKPSYRSVEVKSGEALSGLDLYFRPGAHLHGAVLAPDGQPWRNRGRADAMLDEGVVAREGHVPEPGGLLDADGGFSIEHMYPGVPAVVAVIDSERGLGGTTRVTPTREETAEVTIHLHPLAHVVGRVLRPDGSPAKGADLSVSRHLLRDRTGEDGRFDVRFGVVGLPTHMRALLGTLSPDAGNAVRPWKYYGESRVFEVRAGQEVLDIGDIVLGPYELPKGE